MGSELQPRCHDVTRRAQCGRGALLSLLSLLGAGGKVRGRRTAGDGRNGGVVAGGLAEELRVGYSALIQPKVVGNDRVYVVVCRSRPQHGPRARAPESEKSGRKVV